ncbi:hypothetical protein AB0C76_24130 [Kitasatospora sp. NPDC048722]|uniref:hypothetical protein n=1 Tax=Kitasatospora sp. NPDC048722 TaxID=3155639 RepID=UPI0033F89660
MRFDDRRGVRHLKRMVEAGERRYAGSWVEALWKRLESVDFMSQGLQFAATLLLCFFPSGLRRSPRPRKRGRG